MFLYGQTSVLHRLGPPLPLPPPSTLSPFRPLRFHTHSSVYLLQPERIDPQRAKGYDVRSDVWSLGITLMEVATGRFPYPKWNSVFEQLFQVVQGEPPRLSLVHNGNPFSEEFVNLVNTWLVSHQNRNFVSFSFWAFFCCISLKLTGLQKNHRLFTNLFFTLNILIHCPY